MTEEKMSENPINLLAPLSRRSILKYALATGATLSLADLIAACGGTTPGTAGPTGKRVGQLIYGGMAEASINPLETLGHSESYWAWDALTYVDPTKQGAIEPKLATSWKRLDDVTVEFKLRPDVKFSDGSAMTADDVKFSFDTTINEKLAVFSLLNTVAEVKVVDPQTIRIITSAPDPLIERKTALQFIVPKAVYSKVGTKGFQQSTVGTGKYMITRYSPGQAIELQANPHSWAGQPVTPKVTWQMFTNAQAIQNALEAGQVDIMYLGGGVNALSQLAADSRFSSLSAPSGGPRNLKLDTTKPPYSDKNVRLAMAMAIDVPTLMSTINKGFGTPLNGNMATPQAFGYNPNVKAFPYDPKKAKDMLTQAGFANGFQTDIASATAYHDLMVGVAGYLAKVGINATVVDQDGTTFVKEFYGGSAHGIYMYGANFSPLYDMDLTFRWMTGPLPPTPGKREWVDQKWDDMLQQERTTLDVNKRKSILQQMGQYLHDQVPVIPLDSQEFAYIWTKKVGDFDPSTGFFFLIDKAYKVE
jgi:peptide/nickel transport system substrate-binding protein